MCLCGQILTIYILFKSVFLKQQKTSSVASLHSLKTQVMIIAWYYYTPLSTWEEVGSVAWIGSVDAGIVQDKLSSSSGSSTQD